MALASAFHAMEEASIVVTIEDVEEIRSLLAKAFQLVRKAPAPLSFLLEEKLSKIARLLDVEVCHRESM